jgi:hypothetical protein
MEEFPVEQISQSLTSILNDPKVRQSMENQAYIPIMQVSFPKDWYSDLVVFPAEDLPKYTIQDFSVYISKIKEV